MPNAATREDIRAEALRLRSVFEAQGAIPFDAPVLQPADTFLDLYGEEIRARAYVTSDPIRGEQMLRPDFTVALVEAHMAGRAPAGRYAYAGEVFRRQEQYPARPNEFFQAGFEIFDAADPAAADAEVFAAVAGALDGLALKPATGDIGILAAAVDSLSVSEPRRAALRRHLWRPKRFRALIERYSGRAALPAARQRLLAELAAGADPIASAGMEIGLRSREEVAQRLDVLRQDATEPPIAAGELELIDELLDLRGPLPMVLGILQDLAVDMQGLYDAVARLERRIAALASRGIDVDALDFEASFGRTSLEYYDGFVFDFHVEGRPDLAPVATGGRYDALTRVLGQGRVSPAVGAVIRPELVLQLKAGRN